MRGDSGVAGEGRVVGVPKFHSWGKYTMPLTNINSDRMSNASSGLRIILAIRESIDFLRRDSANAQYMQYLSNSRITSPQTRKKLI